MIPHFYYHPRMLAYDFGPRHPLRPERLRRAIELLELTSGLVPIDPGLANRTDVARVHAEDYIHTVEALSAGDHLPEGFRFNYGFHSADNPPFIGMFEAALAYCGGAVRAAEAVRDGAPLAFSLGGGLHHAQRARASGFCIFDDPAIAIDVLRERFDRVAYVDIDVHHGDGVQWIYYEDPQVLTCSIHETGRTLFPATGFVDETGPCWTSINVPLEPETTGDVWCMAFEQGILPALERFRPGAIVLQMGTDPHFADPLGHLSVSAQEWRQAVRQIRDLGLPTVAMGGGGYNVETVPRMWASAVMTLVEQEIPERLPEELAKAWGSATFDDPETSISRDGGREEAERLLSQLRNLIIPNIPAG